MKCIILLAVVCFCSTILCAQSVSANSRTRIYLVRHGEKEGGKDPILTTAGRKRAGDLMRVLRKKHIRRIYLTDFRRSEMTADSMRIQLGIDTVHYKADTLFDDLINKIQLHGDMRKVILVIGHSNTIAKLIRKLGVDNYPAENIPDNGYDDLFLVSYQRHRARVIKYRYGEASQPSAAMH